MRPPGTDYEQPLDLLTMPASDNDETAPWTEVADAGLRAAASPRAPSIIPARRTPSARAS